MTHLSERQYDVHRCRSGADQHDIGVIGNACQRSRCPRIPDISAIPKELRTRTFGTRRGKDTERQHDGVGSHGTTVSELDSGDLGVGGDVACLAVHVTQSGIGARHPLRIVQHRSQILAVQMTRYEARAVRAREPASDPRREMIRVVGEGAHVRTPDVEQVRRPPRAERHPSTHPRAALDENDLSWWATMDK